MSLEAYSGGGLGHAVTRSIWLATGGERGLIEKDKRRRMSTANHHMLYFSAVYSVLPAVQLPGCGVGRYWSAAGAWVAGSTELHSAVFAEPEEPKQTQMHQTLSIHPSLSPSVSCPLQRNSVHAVYSSRRWQKLRSGSWCPVSSCSHLHSLSLIQRHVSDLGRAGAPICRRVSIRGARVLVFTGIHVHCS